MLTRRTILATTALAPVGLAACGTTISQLDQYATAAENAAIDVLQYLPVNSTTTALIGYLNDAKTAGAAILANAPATGASWAQQLYDAVKAALPIAAPLLSTIPGVSLGIAALQALLPLIASAAGLTAATTAAAGVPGIPLMTPAQALKLYGG